MQLAAVLLTCAAALASSPPEGDRDVGAVPQPADELLGGIKAAGPAEGEDMGPAHGAPPAGGHSDYRFELFPLTGAGCSAAGGGESAWPTGLLRDGGFEYIQKYELGEVDDPSMVEAYDPAASGVTPFDAAFGLRCTKTRNIKRFYLFHDENIGHLGYGLDDVNKILYMCFMLGQDVDGVPGSGGECSYF